MTALHNYMRIALSAVPATDAFGLDLRIDGQEALETIFADAPGLLRRLDPAPGANDVMRKGWIVGFLQRGPLRMPVIMPCDGWVLAAAPDGARAGHGTPLFRILRALETIRP